MKRFALVRVDDNWCPRIFESINFEFICTNKTNVFSKENCENCRYGDTKEQLVKKVEQAIFIAMCKDSRLTNRNLAKFIVEFLGVEDNKKIKEAECLK